MIKKLLFPISERDYFATMGRIGFLMKDLSDDFEIDLFTPSKEVYEDASKKLDLKSPNVRVRLLESKFFPSNYDLRNDLSRIFVKYTHDMFIPGTDLKLWKTTAFDDFWGHITSCSFIDIREIEADVVLLPLMSRDDSPTEETDVFYSEIIFKAKEAGKKIIGYQIYPVFNTNKLMPRFMDAVIVRKEFEREFYVKNGIERDKIHVLSDNKDIYSLSTIEDSYKNHIYNSQISVRRDEVALVVYNHPKFRPQLIEIFRVIKESGVPAVLSLVKRDFTIRDLSEESIIEGLYYDEIKKIGCRFYLVENKSFVPVAMISDLIISPDYIGPLEFASQYGKQACVYNTLYSQMPDVDKVTFINSPAALLQLIKRTQEMKQNAVRVTDIISLFHGKK